MVNLKSAFAAILALLSILIPLGSTQSVDILTGMINCYQTNNPGWCEFRVTTYGDAAWADPTGHWFNTQFDVFDCWCNHIGDGCGTKGSHVSVDSELRYTIEVDIPGWWSDTNGMSFWYAGRHSQGPGDCVTGPGSQMSCLYLFDCS